MPVLSAMSVIAAGVLVRLARGLPFSNADHLNVTEAREIGKAIKVSVRALRMLIIIVFVAMGAVIFAVPVSTIGTTILSSHPPFQYLVDPAVSGFVGFLLTYVLVRILSVIQGDVGLVDLQTKILVQAVERKQATQFTKKRDQSESAPFKNPEGYGKNLVQ